MKLTNFVPFNIAKELKDLNFKEECLKFYLINQLTGESNKILQRSGEVNKWSVDWNSYLSSRISAPLWQQVIDWFLDTHDIDIDVALVVKGNKFNTYNVTVYLYERTEIVEGTFSNRNDASAAGILKAIELIKN